MSDNETIADIATELRQDYKGRSPINRAETTWCRRLIADRIDAAHKREVEKLNSVIQATVSRSDAEIDRLRREVVEASSRAATSAVNLTNEKWRREVGNAAKLREALKVIRGMVNEELEDLKDISDEVRADFISIRGWCDHALAKPWRNCDRFGGDYKMLHTAWFDWTASPSGMNPDGTVKMTFAEWLLALVLTKGGAK